VKITGVSSTVVTFRNETLATSYGRGVTERKHVFVRVEPESGAAGYGEASPLPHFTGEVGETIAWLIENRLSPPLVGLDLFDPEAIDLALNQAIPHHTTAKAGMMMAVYDALGKALELPVCRLCGGRLRTRLPVAEGIGVGTPEDTAAEASRCLAAGVRTIKLKIGVDPDRDIAAVAAVRRVAGRGVAIRVDANQGYRPKDAAQVIRALAPYGIQYVEQPVSAHDLEGLKYVRDAVEVPVAVDESLYGPEEAIELVRRQAADVFVVKLIKAGGIHRSRRVLAIAEAARIPCVLVSPYESSLGVAANIHLAAAATNVPWALEIRVNRIPDDPGSGLVYADGFVTVPEAPGLGVTFNDSLFSRM
jgi:o-succinylbenzoate synthase